MVNRDNTRPLRIFAASGRSASGERELVGAPADWRALGDRLTIDAPLLEAARRIQSAVSGADDGDAVRIRFAPDTAERLLILAGVA